MNTKVLPNITRSYVSEIKKDQKDIEIIVDLSDKTGGSSKEEYELRNLFIWGKHLTGYNVSMLINQKPNKGIFTIYLQYDGIKTMLYTNGVAEKVGNALTGNIFEDESIQSDILEIIKKLAN